MPAQAAETQLGSAHACPPLCSHVINRSDCDCMGVFLGVRKPTIEGILFPANRIATDNYFHSEISQDTSYILIPR